jgi:cytochrome c5
MTALQKPVKWLTKLSIITLLAIGSAYGQQRLTTLRAHIPFPFEVRGISIPAGDYQFKLRIGSRSLTITGAKSGDIGLQIITTLGGSSIFRDAGLVFNRYEGKHVLAELWIPGEEGVLVSTTPKEHRNDRVIAVVESPASNLSGKQIFEVTCERCHGFKGQGNPAARNFFKANIPRLDSAFVQNKSDAELREIISNGSQKMPPVQIGQPSVQHLLDSSPVLVHKSAPLSLRGAGLGDFQPGLAQPASSACVCSLRLRRVARTLISDAGVDSVDSWMMRLLHVCDTLVPVHPGTLPARLQSAGFTSISVNTEGKGFRFSAICP